MIEAGNEYYPAETNTLQLQSFQQDRSIVTYYLRLSLIYFTFLIQIIY